MITDIFFLVSIFGLIIIGLIKLYNLVNQENLYGVKGIMLGFGFCFLLWFFMFTAFSASITNTSTSTITGVPTGTVTVTDGDNSYLALLPFMNLVNVLFLICIVLSFAEVIKSITPAIFGPKAGPRNEKYYRQ